MVETPKLWSEGISAGVPSCRVKYHFGLVRRKRAAFDDAAQMSHLDWEPTKETDHSCRAMSILRSWCVPVDLNSRNKHESVSRGVLDLCMPPR